MPPFDLDLLKDHSVLVTGGASGLGEATARKFHTHGAYITIPRQTCKTTPERSSLTNWATVPRSPAAILQTGSRPPQPSSTPPTSPHPRPSTSSSPSGGRRRLVDLVLDHPSTTTPSPPAPATTAIDVDLVAESIATYLALHDFRLPPAAARHPRPRPRLPQARVHGPAVQRRRRDVHVRCPGSVPRRALAGGQGRCQDG